jgi:hypothetical protein
MELLFRKMLYKVSGGVRDRKKNSIYPFFPWMSEKVTKGLTALKLQMDCDQMAMGLPPVTSSVFLIANTF